MLYYLFYYRRLRLLWDQPNMLRDIDPMVRIFNLEALLVHQANETCPRSFCHYCKKPGHMIADSRKRQNANSRRQSDTAHLAALPETPTESETFQSPYSIGPLKHYFYDLRSTPTPDTDSFTPRQRKQIQRLNPSCHISSSSATGICSPLRLQHRGLLTFFGCIEEDDW